MSMIGKKTAGGSLLAIVAVSCLLTAVGAARAAEAPASLYKRLGGYDAIAAVTDEFIARLIADPTFTRFFSGLSKDSAGKLRQHVVEQVCAMSGGPCVYMGRDMKTSHAGLGITEAEWNASVKHFVGALDKYKVGDREKGELLAALNSVKKDIVEKP